MFPIIASFDCAETGIGLNRKALADLAVRDEVAFNSIIEKVKGALKEKKA